jgi:hypothetical protein
MIYGAVVRIAGKLPLLVDLREMPAPTDLAVLCTNVRTRDGKQPQYIEDPQAWFLIPIHEITLIEFPAGSMEPAAGMPAERNGHAASVGANDVMVVEQPPDSELLESDEDLLARIRQL